MLPKKNRADKKAIERIFKEGGYFNSPNLTFKFIINSLKSDTRKKQPRISVIVPKNIAKKAVDRNFLRRLGYSVLQKKIQDFPSGFVGVFIFKKFQKNILILENEIKTILDKIN